MCSLKCWSHNFLVIGCSANTNLAAPISDDAPLAVIELVDRDLQAKKIDVKKKPETSTKTTTETKTKKEKTSSKKQTK